MVPSSQFTPISLKVGTSGNWAARAPAITPSARTRPPDSRACASGRLVTTTSTPPASSSWKEGAEPAIETQITSFGFSPIADSQPASARCQMPALAVPDARSARGFSRIARSRSASVRHGASARTKIAAASSLTSPTGAKSSGAMFVMPRQCSEPISTVTSVSVWPSARESAPRLWPVTPSPPVTFTTLIGTPRSCSRSTAIWRAMRSVPPPAAHGHTSRIGPSGKGRLLLHPIAEAISRAEIDRCRARLRAPEARFGEVSPERSACKAGRPAACRVAT